MIWAILFISALNTFLITVMLFILYHLKHGPKGDKGECQCERCKGRHYTSKPPRIDDNDF